MVLYYNTLDETCCNHTTAWKYRWRLWSYASV